MVCSLHEEWMHIRLLWVITKKKNGMRADGCRNTCYVCLACNAASHRTQEPYKSSKGSLQLQALRNTTEGGEHHISSVANGTSTAHPGLRIPLSLLLLLHLLWHPAQQSQPVALPDLHSPWTSVLRGRRAWLWGCWYSVQHLSGSQALFTGSLARGMGAACDSLLTKTGVNK